MIFFSKKAENSKLFAKKENHFSSISHDTYTHISRMSYFYHVSQLVRLRTQSFAPWLGCDETKIATAFVMTVILLLNLLHWN